MNSHSSFCVSSPPLYVASVTVSDLGLDSLLFRPDLLCPLQLSLVPEGHNYRIIEFGIISYQHSKAFTQECKTIQLNHRLLTVASNQPDLMRKLILFAAIGIPSSTRANIFETARLAVSDKKRGRTRIIGRHHFGGNLKTKPQELQNCSTTWKRVLKSITPTSPIFSVQQLLSPMYEGQILHY